MKQNLTIILPIHNLDINQEYLNTLFESISKQDEKNFHLLIASFDKHKDRIRNLNSFNLEYSFLSLPEELESIYPNYTEIVNFAVHSVETDYFTILQYDDVMNNIFVKCVNQYTKAYPNVSVFMPIVLEFDGNSFVRSVNEAVWNIDYTEKQGYLDFETLKKMNIFSFVGAVYKTNDFLVNNGFKHSIKIYFEYEYFLRILYQTAEVMVIPKFMLRHTINRENSLSKYYENIDTLEAKFYFDSARKEYFFVEDRQLVYNPNAS